MLFFWMDMLPGMKKTEYLCVQAHWEPIQKMLFTGQNNTVKRLETTAFSPEKYINILKRFSAKKFSTKGNAK